MTAYPKTKPWRSKPYRRLVAALPCIRCGFTGSQCAHGPALGRGIKAGDNETFPLCADAPGYRGCHGLFDRYVICSRATRHYLALRWAAETPRPGSGSSSASAGLGYSIPGAGDAQSAPMPT